MRAGPRLGSGGRNDDAGLDEGGDLGWGKPGLAEDGGVMLPHAWGLANHAWPRTVSKGDGQGRQLYLGSLVTAGWRDRDIEQAAARQQVHILEEVVGLADGRPGDVGTLAAPYHFGLRQLFQHGLESRDQPRS